MPTTSPRRLIEETFASAVPGLRHDYDRTPHSRFVFGFAIGAAVAQSAA
jgi:hypothetical protein